MRVAVIAPVWFPVPPAGYGGIELVVSLLADGLVDAGHDVTLYASGGSRTKANLITPMDEPPDPRDLGNVWYDAFHALYGVPPARRRRRRARPRRHRRAGVRRDAARHTAGRAHAARTMGRTDATLLQRRRAARTPGRDQRIATERQPGGALRRDGVQRHRSLRVSVSREEGRLPDLHRSRESRQGAEGSDHDRAALRVAAADDPQVQRAPRARVLRARDQAAARERHRDTRARAARREGRPARAAPVRWCSRSAGPSRSGW